MNTPQNPYRQNHPTAPQQHGGAYGAPNQGGQGGQGWGQPQSGAQTQTGGQPQFGGQPQPAKKSHKGIKILLVALVILALLVLLAEFGLRAFVKGKITDGVKEQAAQSQTEVTEDPKISFGSNSLLLGALAGNIKQVDITLPSTLKVSDSGDGNSDVTGNPEVRMQAKNIKGRSESDMRAGDLNMQSEIPTELMLAQAQKGQAKGQSESNNAFASMMTLTGIEPDTQAGVLNFEIGGGLAKLSMKPKVENGQLAMDVEGGKIFGFDMPQSVVNSVRDSLTKQNQGAVIEGMDVTEVKVTDHGMELHLHGTDVNLAEIGAKGAKTQDRQGTDGAQQQEERPGQPDQPFGSSGDGYGSGSRAA